MDLIARGGAVGIHPILATQRPSSDMVTPRLKGNLITRIALPVPDRASSMVILDCADAENLDKIPGRLLITRKARLVEAQAFDSRVVEMQNPDHAPTRLLNYATTRLSNRESRTAGRRWGTSPKFCAMNAATTWDVKHCRVCARCCVGTLGKWRMRI